MRALASAIQPNAPRELGGVLEAYRVAVLGVPAVLDDGRAQIRVCRRCKAHAHNEFERCQYCVDGI